MGERHRVNTAFDGSDRVGADVLQSPDMPVLMSWP
jgi:hypothetical protein